MSGSFPMYGIKTNHRVCRKEESMNLILLSGGSGTRLWPLSNEVRSKQFIKLFKTKDGSRESMLQRVCRQISELGSDVAITVATSKAQVSAIHNQLGNRVSICAEPCRKDTFAAITLAAAFLHDIKKVPLHETVVFCPVDPYVESDYFKELRELHGLAEKGGANLSLLGIEPTYPSEKYGYIIPKDKKRVSTVLSFKEKPGAAQAKLYIGQGALWNAGVFAFQLGYILEKAGSLAAYTNYWDLYANYGALIENSFDYMIAEKEKHMQVMRFVGKWKDVGTWNTLTDTMDEEIVGNAVMDGMCKNVHIVNELDIPVLCMGLENAVISAGPDGILAADKERSSYMKPFIDQMKQQVMYAEKSWGTYHVLDVEQESLTIKVTLNAGEKMNYHSHGRRKEVWVVIAGSGKAVMDGIARHICAGDILEIRAGCRHMVAAETELKIIEVQIGKEISVRDKQKYPEEV